jgi:hypothetical protein
MDIGRLNAVKSTQIDGNAQDVQNEQTVSGNPAQDTIEISPPVNNLSKILGEGVENKTLVEADQSAFPQFPADQPRQEHLGTSFENFKFPDTEGNDRFGFGNPEEEDPIATLDQKSGLAFDPERDLNLPTGDVVSKDGKSSSTDKTSQLQKQNDSLKKQNDSLQQQVGSQQAQINSLEGQVYLLKSQMEQLLKERAEAKAQAQANKEVNQQTGNTPAKDPNPDAPDNSPGGPFDPLVNNFGSPLRINKPYVDPVLEDTFGASDVLIQTNQAVDPNPDADSEEGGAKRAILSTTDAVTDPNPDVGSLLNNLNNFDNE